MSPEQYRKFGCTLRNRITINYHALDLFKLEDLWFSLGHADTLLIVVDRGAPEYVALAEAGLLYDIRSMNLTSWESTGFYDFIQSKLFGRGERVRLCNMIRDALVSGADRFRWCGSELESLFHERIYFRSVEMCGLKRLGYNWDCNGILGQDSFSSASPFDYTGRMYSDICNRFDDLGQRKLYACMLSAVFADEEMIYIGSAPGSGWIHALNDIRYGGVVHSFDPRPLDRTIIPETFQIIHHEVLVQSVDDIMKYLDVTKKYVFIWDVRADMPEDSDARLQILDEEISTLNSIIAHSDFTQIVAFMQIKVNFRAITAYSLPAGGGGR